MATRSFSKSGGWSSHNVATYRSGLEEKLAEQLSSRGVPVAFEQYEVTYVIPASNHRYTPDFVLPNGVIIEGKGLFDAEDRKKHLLIKAQHPGLDIRFVFSSSRTKLYKGSPTTYGMWCEKNGFKFADKAIPVEWMKEPVKEIPKDSLVLKTTKKNKEDNK